MALRPELYLFKETDMEVNSEKIYEKYKKISQKQYSRVTTSQLNVLYNIVCRARRDEEYRAQLCAYDTGEGDTIVGLIDKYFASYNTVYGLDIRDSLTEFEDPDFTEGAYFLVTTYKICEDGKLVEHSPLEFTAGDVAHVKATLYSHGSDKPMAAKKLVMQLINDNRETDSMTLTDSNTMEFDVTLSRPGSVRFRIEAQDADGKLMIGSESAAAGVIFSKDEVFPYHSAPTDIEEFWLRQIDRLMAVNPTDTSSDGYEGNVIYAFDMPKKNHFGIRKFDESYLKLLFDNGYTPPAKTTLETHDSYELYLKAPGPCHASGFISLPKSAKPHSLPLTISFDGYSAYAPMPVYSDNEIRMHSTHHGYEMAMPSKGYYFTLSRGGILASYGRGVDAPNADYKDINDCYMTYLHLRNLQMLRFATDPALSGFIENLHEYWNGEVKFIGGSMGGYQTVFTSALSTLLKKRSAPFTVIYAGASVPAFCNLAGSLDGRIATALTQYCDGMDYYDAALVAQFVEGPLEVQRSALGDESCPTSSILAMFNSLPKTIEKKIKFLQNSSHGYIPDEHLQYWHCYKYNMGDKDFNELVF